MNQLSPLGLNVLVFAIGLLLVSPGLVALYLSLHRDVEEKRQALQVQAMAGEIQHLQAQVDDQQREISRLRVQVSTLQASQKGLLEMAKRLHRQLVDGGVTPIVDVDKLGDLLA